MPDLDRQIPALIDCELQLADADVALAADGNRPTREIIFSFAIADTDSENGDNIEADEWVASAEKLIGEGIDINHTPNGAVGAFTSPVMQVQKDRQTHIAGKGKLWSWRYPLEVAAIEEAHKAGQLRGSMAVGFLSATCSECGEEMGGGSAYSKFYKHRNEKHGGKGSRRLRGINPRGAALLIGQKPAYPGVEVLALAASTRKEAEEEEDRAMPDTEKKDEKGVQQPPGSNDAALAERIGKLEERLAVAETKNTDLEAKLGEAEAKNAALAAEKERVQKAPARYEDALAQSRKKAKNDAFTFEEATAARIKERAESLPDDQWDAFVQDLVAMVPTNTGTHPAVASKQKDGAPNDPPPSGAAHDQPDEKADDDKAACHVALACMLGGVKPEDARKRFGLDEKGE